MEEVVWKVTPSYEWYAKMSGRRPSTVATDSVKDDSAGRAAVILWLGYIFISLSLKNI